MRRHLMMSATNERELVECTAEFNPAQTYYTGTPGNRLISHANGGARSYLINKESGVVFADIGHTGSAPYKNLYGLLYRSDTGQFPMVEKASYHYSTIEPNTYKRVHIVWPKNSSTLVINGSRDFKIRLYRYKQETDV